VNPKNRKETNMRRRSPHLAGHLGVLVSVAFSTIAAGVAFGYPPAVGILGASRNCLACHADNGPWKDGASLILDVLDKESGTSLKQADGSFVITATRGEAKTVLTVIGWRADSSQDAPYRTAWLYVDPARIADASSLSKFAPGWYVNLPMACRLVGDTSEAYRGSHVTVLPMTIRPGDDAADAQIELQVMLTRGESVKGKPREGMIGSYFERVVRLVVARKPEGR
jgi:hypothetical protein